jgi:hypothetical protein
MTTKQQVPHRAFSPIRNDIPFGRRRFASAAEAGLHFLRRFTARLKAAPFQNTVLCGTAEAVPFSVKVKIKINVNGVGQECPTHTGRGARNIMGHPRRTAGSSPGFQPDSE